MVDIGSYGSLDEAAALLRTESAAPTGMPVTRIANSSVHRLGPHCLRLTPNKAGGQLREADICSEAPRSRAIIAHKSAARHNRDSMVARVTEVTEARMIAIRKIIAHGPGRGKITMDNPGARQKGVAPYR